MGSSANDQVESDLVARLRGHFTRNKRLAAAYLFGSRASGVSTAESDIDIAVILATRRGAEDAFWDCAGIKGDLEEMLRPLKVDVLDVERVPCRIAHEILKTGKLIAENDEGRRVEVEAKRRAEYLDFLPRLSYYRKAVLGDDRAGKDPREAR